MKKDLVRIFLCCVFCVQPVHLLAFDELDAMINAVDKQVNHGTASQKKIDAIDDDISNLQGYYRDALKDLYNVTKYNEQREKLIQSQDAEIVSINKQIERVSTIERDFAPLMEEMVSGLSEFVQLDLPFLAKERKERVEKLQKLLLQANVTNAEKYRRIMEAYEIENEYGRTIEAYRGAIRLNNNKEQTVDFLRYGRVALVYMSLDGENLGYWNKKKGGWEVLDSSYRLPVRVGMRMAREQVPPDLMIAPLGAPQDAQ